MLGLGRCAGFSPAASRRGRSALRRTGSSWRWPLFGVQALGHTVSAVWPKDSITAVPRLQSTGSILVTHGLSCSVTCRICPTRDKTHWQANSLSLRHQGSLLHVYNFKDIFFSTYLVFVLSLLSQVLLLLKS